MTVIYSYNDQTHTAHCDTTQDVRKIKNNSYKYFMNSHHLKSVAD